jgi:hypothetical protein
MPGHPHIQYGPALAGSRTGKMNSPFADAEILLIESLNEFS